MQIFIPVSSTTKGRDIDFKIVNRPTATSSAASKNLLKKNKNNGGVEITISNQEGASKTIVGNFKGRVILDGIFYVLEEGVDSDSKVLTIEVDKVDIFKEYEQSSPSSQDRTVDPRLGIGDMLCEGDNDWRGVFVGEESEVTSLDYRGSDENIEREISGSEDSDQDLDIMNI